LPQSLAAPYNRVNVFPGRTIRANKKGGIKSRPITRHF
jgi:hypothetical protein